MSKAVNSPTARLLQSSRLFSLPRPLPQPDLTSTSSTGSYRASDSATTPYPTHQSITTPKSSLSRGDWGLKRPLPAKGTRSSTPHVRVLAQDTWDYITDFASAADHTQTVAKWNELGVPMVKGRPYNDGQRGRGKSAMSVYEDAVDNTDPKAVDGPKQAPAGGLGTFGMAGGSQPKQRWKFDGPFVAGMSEGEFDRYLKRAIGKRKDEWLEFVREREARSRVRNDERQARHRGTALKTEDIAEATQHHRPSDEELRVLMKHYRDDHARHGLRSQLTGLLSEFLDLPPISIDTGSDAFADKLMSGMQGATGPPTTHPAGGLSHLRSATVMENHPLHGPQLQRTPINARVIRPRSHAMGAERRAKLGVAGVITDDPNTGTYSGRSAAPTSESQAADASAQALDPDLKGGNKLWVVAQKAYLNERGRISLKVERADREAVAVQTGDVESILEAKRPSSSGRSAQTNASFPPPSQGSWSGRTVSERSRASLRMKGFDAQVKQSGGDEERQFKQMGALYRNETQQGR